MLLYFIADLLRNPELQRKFTRNPDAAMDQFGLTPEHKAIMTKADRQKALEVLDDELANTELFAAVWVKGGVTISAVHPQQGSSRAPVSLQVKGDFFAPDAFATLKLGDVNYLAMTISVTRPHERNSMLTATLNIPPGARPGKYDISVSNPEGWFCIMKDAFTVTNG